MKETTNTGGIRRGALCLIGKQSEAATEAQALHLVRLKEVKALTGLSRSEIYRRSGLGSFPRRVQLGGKSVAWVKSEIEAWIAARIAERDGQGGQA